MDLPAWTQLLSQQNRLVEIDTALPQAFVVERLHAREAISEPFVFQLDCLSPHAYVELQPLLASELTVRLHGPGNSRTWHGYCTQAAQLGSEGGLARFRLKLEPWTALLQLRRNRLIYQDLDELGILDRLFSHYPQSNYRFDVSRTLETRPIRTQWESDFDFVTRLLAEAGLAYRFEHSQPEGSSTEGASQKAHHVLVIYDAQASIPDASPATLRFHRIDATEEADAAVIFTEQRQASTNTVTVASWQSEQVRMTAAQARVNDTDLPALEVYQAGRSGVFPSDALAQSAADVRLQALTLPSQLHAGAGSGRNLAPGYAFTLEQHPDLSGTRFIPLVVEHTAINNLGSEAVALLGAPELDQGDYRNRFVCVPEQIPVVPVFVAKPTAPGPQTAIVVGLPDSGVTATRDHHTRVQFWWQRGANPNAGGLQETGSQDPGHAPGDATSGAWVPVSEWMSGPNFGSNFLPRLNSEVLVDFLHGDLDQPIIVAQLYDGENIPPYAAGEDSDTNHPGVISGMRTQGLDGASVSRWIADDTPGQLRHQLDTDLADSRLSLGVLVDQDGASRGALRGEGFEVNTAGWSIQRAGEGFLISTSSRTNAASTLHDAQEAVVQLTSALQTSKEMSEAISGAGGFPLTANAQQEALLKAIDPTQDGKYTDAVNGQSAAKPKAGSREPGESVEHLASAMVLQEGPSHVLYSTSHSLLAHASGSQHWTVQQDAHFTAGSAFSSVSGESSGLFVSDGPLQVIAANGPVSVQAHTAGLEVLADKTVSITSTEDEVQIQAQQKIVLQTDQSAITLEGDSITFACTKNFIVKASEHPFRGGASNPATLPLLPIDRVDMFNEQFHLVANDGETPLAGRGYRVTAPDGQVWEGTTDEDGLTERIYTRQAVPLTVEILAATDERTIE